MPSRSPEQAAKRRIRRRRLLAGALILLVLAVGYVGWQVYRVREGLREVAAAMDHGGGTDMPNRDAVRADLMNKLGLTREQRDKIESIRSARGPVIPDDGRFPDPQYAVETLRQMEAVLTPEQRAGARKYFREMMNRRDETARETLPPDQYEKFREKRAEKLGLLLDMMNEKRD